MQGNEVTAVVLDGGSGTSKAGFAGQDFPQAVIPSIVGFPKHTSGDIPSDYCIGETAECNADALNIKFPIEHGYVCNWDCMEKLWHHAFYQQLRVKPEDHPVLLAEPPRNPRISREKMTEIMFESFHVPAMYVALQAVLSLCSVGRHTGVVLECGDGATHVVPVYEGYGIRHAVWPLEFAGRTVTDYLRKLLSERQFYTNTRADLETVKYIKERLCYVALDFEGETKSSSSSPHIEKSYKLPDGRVIEIGSERFRASESLFQPSFFGLESAGVHEAVRYSIQKCESDIQNLMYSNIVLSGGSTMFSGFADRMVKELRNITPSDVTVEVTASSGRKYSVWRGGSVLASMSTFQEMCISTEEYDEYGPTMVHRKCF